MTDTRDERGASTFQGDISLQEFVNAVFRQADLRYMTRFEEADKRYEQRFKAQSDAIVTALASTDRAILKAEAASERRFEGVNEFRAMLNDILRQMMPRSEAEQRFLALGAKMDEMQRRLDKSEGTGSGLKSGWGYLLGAIGLISTLLTIGLLLLGRK